MKRKLFTLWRNELRRLHRLRWVRYICCCSFLHYFQDFHKQSSRSIFPAPSSSTPIASTLIPILWSCSTWSFMIAKSGVTTIILETAFLCNALINLGKSWKIKLFPNPVGRMAMRPLPRNTFEDNLFIPFVKYPHLGNRQALAVQLFNRAWLDGEWPSHGDAISHFLSASTTLWCWQEVSNLANQRVYQILVYRHELFKINFTGVPSSSSPVSPHFPRSFTCFIFRLCSTIWMPGTSYWAVQYSRNLVTRTLKGNKKQFELARVRVIGVDWIIQFAMLIIDSLLIFQH